MEFLFIDGSHSGKIFEINNQNEGYVDFVDNSRYIQRYFLHTILYNGLCYLVASNYSKLDMAYWYIKDKIKRSGIKPFKELKLQE